MKRRVPETITCVNCNHSIVIKLYEVDTTINSAQGHFHTIHHPAEPTYTVYCINCGHFMTNDPRPAPAKAAEGTRAARSIAEKRPASSPQNAAPSREPKKAAKTTVSERAKKRESKAAAAAKPRHKPVQARKKSQTTADNKKSASAKQPRPQRKKAK